MNNDINKIMIDVPTIDINRSKMSIRHNHKATFNAGYLVPFFAKEIIPGTTLKLNTAFTCRMRTPLTPIMDDLYLDYSYYYIPFRILWDHFKEFMGENKDAWASNIEYTIPQVIFENGATQGNICDHLGLPINVPMSISSLYIRAYRMIINEYYIDKNTMDSELINFGDGPDDEDTDELLRTCKLHDYFTSCLPSPQRSINPVYIPLGTEAPVKAISGKNIDVSILDNTLQGKQEGTSGLRNLVFNNLTGNVGYYKSNESIDNPGTNSFAPNNLWADLSEASSATINSLRQAFAVQKLLERDARGGSRYRELILSHFGTHVADSRVQIPEYLSGHRIPINVQQVVQQSSSVNNGEYIQQPLGQTGAFSQTNNVDEDFTASFTEPGIVMGVMTVRNVNSYCQGIPKQYSRKKRFDFYYPEFSNLGEQPVLRKEIYATGQETNDDKVFGYQEAWADYRYMPNTLSGEFKTTAQQNLNIWHFGEKFDQPPILSSNFIYANSDLIDRTLAVSSEINDQFFIDMSIDITQVVPMPLYSVPGLIDHH